MGVVGWEWLGWSGGVGVVGREWSGGCGRVGVVGWEWLGGSGWVGVVGREWLGGSGWVEVAYISSEQLSGLSIRYPLTKLGKSSWLGNVAYGKPPKREEGGGATDTHIA